MTESLEERVQRLEDYEAIRRTWCDYLFNLDAGNWEPFGEVFTEDATVEIIGISEERDGIFKGRDGHRRLVQLFAWRHAPTRDGVGQWGPSWQQHEDRARW